MPAQTDTSSTARRPDLPRVISLQIATTACSIVFCAIANLDLIQSLTVCSLRQSDDGS